MFAALFDWKVAGVSGFSVKGFTFAGCKAAQQGRSLGFKIHRKCFLPMISFSDHLSISFARSRDVKNAPAAPGAGGDKARIAATDNVSTAEQSCSRVSNTLRIDCPCISPHAALRRQSSHPQSHQAEAAGCVHQ